MKEIPCMKRIQGGNKTWEIYLMGNVFRREINRKKYTFRDTRNGCLFWCLEMLENE